MAVISFDTLKHVERLTAAGVPDAQARAEASALRDVLAESLDTTIATKGDIARLEGSFSRLEASTKADVREVRDELRETKAELKSDIAHLEASTKAAVREVRDELRETKAELKADSARVENRIDLLHKDMQSMELRMTIKLGAMLAATAGVIIAALKMLH